MPTIYRIACIVIFSACHSFLWAQNMNSPYSVYGIGDIDKKNYDRSSGMGGSGLALQSPFYVLEGNPAAMASLIRSFYQVDLAATGKTLTYHGNPINAENSNNSDFWIKRLALSVKLTDHWASGIGFRPFSNVNYNMQGSKSVLGSNAVYNTWHEGDGGLTEYYWNNAFSIGKQLSLGLKSSILAGSVNAKETVADGNLNLPIEAQVQDYFGSARFKVGGQYLQPLSKNWKLTAGAVYSPRVKLIAERTLTVTEGGTDLLSDEFISNYIRYVPQTWGGGLAFNFKDKVTYAIDFMYEDWSANRFRDKGWQMSSSRRLSAGVEWAQKVYSGNQWLEKNFFQVGAYFDEGSLQVNNQPIREWGITAGMGGILGRNLLYTASIEVGQRGTTRQNLIRENFVQLSFSISYRDFLFSKGRKWD